jgi:uncharacterized membrane protein YidH (DUF202 family)
MDEQEVLAIVRTLLAYERNYLSIERTQLAQLRTGITMALITPPAAATLAYAFDFLPKDYYVSIVVYIFLILITLYGIWIALRSYFGLKETRKIQSKIQKLQLEVVGNSSTINTLLKDIITKNAQS